MTGVPKVIHYCWFGRKEKPANVIEFIKNWEQMLPGYKIVEWNEDNFDINCCNYVREAYEREKFAFVSDYARLYALYRQGGIYLDTDVEVLKSLDELLEDDNLTFGFEEFNYIATSTIISPPRNAFIKKFMESYHKRTFVNPDGSLDMTTNVSTLTDMLVKLGCQLNNTKQLLYFEREDIRIMEQIVFSPYDYANYIDKSGSQSFTIHHFGHSWASHDKVRSRKIKKILLAIIGGGNLKKLRQIQRFLK
ncbi:MAG: glycosyl transferase [Algicola sp.]|nr:glycosyl transferase [Algicola sp.]